VDANGTRFHLLLGKDDWARCVYEDGTPLGDYWDGSPPAGGSALAWDGECGELTLEPRLFRFQTAAPEAPLTPERRRGAGRDRFGNWYWIAASRQEIRVQSSGSGRASHFWAACDGETCAPRQDAGGFQPCLPAPPPEPCTFSGLAVTEDHYLVVGSLEPPGVLVFDLHAGGPPRRMFWPDGVPFAPFDISPRPGGGVWILDRDNERYWELDRHFRVRFGNGSIVTVPGAEDLFQPVDGSSVRRTPEDRFGEGVSLAAASPLAGPHYVAVEGLPDGSILLLESDPSEPFSRVCRYRDGAPFGEPVSLECATELIEEEHRAGFRLLGHDFAFVPARDYLYVVGRDGNQAFVFHVSRHGDRIALEPKGEYLPLRLFGGKALVATGGSAWYDIGERWVRLVGQKRPRYVAAATFITPPLDGRDPDCLWRRLILDACIPPETGVQIWTASADDLHRLAVQPWTAEPQPYRRGDGSELPFTPPLPGDARGSWELLFQGARGRYLRIKVGLTGSGRATPRLYAMRAYYPAFSYLDRYLPAVYREEPESAWFLDRFLANVEGLLTATEDRIAAAQVLFDHASAPAGTLGWLCGWFGVALDAKWEESRSRLFLRHAMQFFQFRGTLPGLRMALELALEQCPGETVFRVENAALRRPGGIRIVERFRSRGAIRWNPARGRDELNRVFSEALGLSPPQAYPVTAPPGEQAAKWREFSLATLGFVPAPETAARLAAWRDFLARRYSRIAGFNTTYGRSDADFGSAPYPAELPPDGKRLEDWFQFQGVVLPSRDTAHKFTVLLPVPRSGEFNTAEQQRRLELTRRVVDLEKPAHTSFDVKFYWARFRIGEARLGEDTAVERGSRDPQLMPPAVLDQSYLAETYLAAGHPMNVRDRRVLNHGSCTREA
jgi:phage tail-like protein